MTDFIVTITDQAQLDGITWAREQYNASLPPPPPPMPPPDTVTGGLSVNGTNGNGMIIPPPPPGIMPMVGEVTPPLETDEEYVQHVMEQASISYADQKLRKQYRDDYEQAAAGAGRAVI